MLVEVAYAQADRQWLRSLEVSAGTTAMEAIRQSGFLEAFPDVDAERSRLGVFGEPCGGETLLRPGDRVEIYRPLRRDPKAARRLRARHDPLSSQEE